jgi:UDP-N-acetylmuramate dehydrogenase
MTALHVEEGIPLAPYTTFGIGGPAEFFVNVMSEGELLSALAWAREKHVAISVLGGGSNVLVSDAGVRGLVIRIAIPDITYAEEGKDVLVSAGAGVVLDELIGALVNKDIWGMENLSLIPGTVGATPVQNVGAYGVEVKDLIESVDCIDSISGERLTLSCTDCEFGYRDSYFKRPGGKHLIVTRVTYRLIREARPQVGYGELAKRFETVTPTLTAIRDAVIAIRTAKLPDWHVTGTAGSFFKNPVVSRDKFKALQERFPDLPEIPVPSGDMKLPLGFVLDRILNLKGYRDGAVGLHEKQALVIVNHGGSRAEDVERLAAMIHERVERELGISIEREVVTLA